MELEQVYEYIREEMLVEVGKGISHPHFKQVLELLLAKGEFWLLHQIQKRRRQ